MVRRTCSCSILRSESHALENFNLSLETSLFLKADLFASRRVPDNLRAEVHSRSETAGDISGHHHHGKRLMQQALRPFRPAEGKRRRSSKSPKRREQSPFKRMRAGQEQGQDVIVIDDDDDDGGDNEKGGQSESGSRGKASTGDTVRDFKATLKHFRIEEKMLA